MCIYCQCRNWPEQNRKHKPTLSGLKTLTYILIQLTLLRPCYLCFRYLEYKVGWDKNSDAIRFFKLQKEIKKKEM